MSFVAVPGTRIGDYVVVSEIGQGGMAVVHLAEHPNLGRKVALKLLADKLSDDQTFRDRFIREARIAAGIEHPNIVPIHDAGEVEGLLFIAMRYVEGIDLGKLLEREESLSLGRTRAIVSQVAAALDAAHTKGLVHRDVKPSNVLLAHGEGPGGSDHVYLADFGLARPQLGSDLTLAGELYGTLDYMAPEQFDGRPLDARTDVYALACVAYECLTGEPPFRKESSLAKAAAHLGTRPVPPSDLNADLPKEVDDAILRGLAKDKTNRFDSAGAFATSLAGTDAVEVQSAISIVPNEQPGHAIPQEERKVVSGLLVGVLGGRATDAPVGLPGQPTGFLGRERELAEALELIRRPETRLLTLTGPGGSGKTRLTVELAVRLASEYPDGVWFVPLAALTDPALVVATIAQRVGVRETAEATTAQALIHSLGPRHVLLVLDNLERLLPAAAPPVGELLRETENVVLLASSQQALHIGGEREYLVPPMSIDDAVSLFAERARAVRQDFLVDGQRAVVEAVCARLDRLPLAIELAAARVRILSVEQLLDRLQQRLPLLTSGPADAPERQRTLRAAIEWSHDLLDEAEQALFVRLAAFAGGCTLDAAERICNADLNTLESLVDKNLLRVDEDADGDLRFLMLATIREFALERLAAFSEHEELLWRHARFFSALAEEAYENRFVAEAEWSERLELDHDNLRAALSVWAETDPERALELAGALGWFWLSHGHLAEGRGNITDALERSSGHGPARARALTTAGTLVGRSGDADAGLALLTEGVDLWRDFDDRDEFASALDALGWLLVYDAGDAAASLDAFERSLALRRELADGPGETRSLAGVCQALVGLGNVERAESLSRELLDRADGNLRTEHFAYHFLADCALIRGDGQEAGNRYQESLRAAVGLGDVVETSYEVQGVAMAAAATGDLRRALRLAAAVEALHESLGLPLGDTFFEALLQRHIEGARESLGAQADTVWAEGRAMTFEDAVDFASTQGP